MQEKIIYSIQKHLNYMDSVLILSMKIFEAAEQENESRLTLESNNRERLINIIDQIQSKTEIMIKALPSSSLGQEFIDVLILWSQEVANWVEDVDQIDQKILDKLYTLKESTTKEIATIFKSRQQFKGYNLNSVRK
ncbi:MAG: hypothetical protein HN353_03385 [Bdellovibrionales bacterium]|jgi:hypothetical protein|nr:hypothetical protein [Bdellovibrionales bacterium]MBT3526073.1 hypothetical protein [Bdellovibrionales bacterium]MBT7669115.1 hypothetical protein [Bdellovibrionales bacterium]